MTLDDIRRLIEPEKEALRAKGVAALYVFGSVARGEAGPGSDVDVLIDIEPGRGFHIIDLANVYNRLTKVFGAEVDIVTSRSIKNALHERAVQDAGAPPSTIFFKLSGAIAKQSRASASTN